MLSIIICSIRPQQLQEITVNIQNTVGVPFEIIGIDNRQQPRGITAVYNDGARRAKYEHLCFVHEDVQFNTQNWGQILIRLFENKNLGLVGVAGAAHKPKMPTGWGPSGITDRFVKINMIQHYKDEKLSPSTQYYNSSNEKIAEVVCLDGLFLASKKSIIQEIPFDEENLKGFHCYDLDISLAIGQKYKVAVTYEILVEHFSEGNIDEKWIDNTFILHDKWKDKLPRTIGKITHKELVHCEKESFRYLLRLIRKKESVKKARQLLETCGVKQLSYKTYLKLNFSIFRMYYLKKN